MNLLKFRSIHDILGIKVSLTFYSYHRDSIFFFFNKNGVVECLNPGHSALCKLWQNPFSSVCFLANFHSSDSQQVTLS